MISTGGRNDIFIQWFSDEYVRSHKNLFNKVVIESGQAVFVIRDGKVSEVITETTKDILPGFFGKIKEALTGKSELQVLFVDLNRKHLRIPISGYSKDRTKISCVANIDVQVSRDNIQNVIRMLSNNLISDTKWGDEYNLIREVYVEDISDIFTYDTEVVVKSFVFTNYNSNEITERMGEFNADISSAINSLMPHWSEIGLNVQIVSIDISENEYEEVMKEKSESSMNLLRLDIEYMKSEHEMTVASNLEKLQLRLEHEKDSVLITYNLENKNKVLEDARNTKILDTENDIQIRKLNDQYYIGKREDERDQARKDDDLVTYVIKGSKQAELDQQISFMKAKGEIDFEQQFRKAVTEFEIQLAKADADAQKARQQGFDEGLAKGRSESNEAACKAAYNEGYAHGMLRMQDSVDVKNTYGSYKAPSLQQSVLSGQVFCRFCGKSMNEDSKFCPGCGKEAN